jgi:hypothetical protein
MLAVVVWGRRREVIARQEWEMCCAYTYLPLLDEELGSVPERCDICIILKLRIYRMVDNLFV